MIRLSGLQLRILGALNECARPSQRDIATAAKAHQSSVSRSIRKLIAAGLVTRTAIGYEITPDGTNAVAARESPHRERDVAAWRHHWAEQARGLIDQARRVQEEVASLQKPVADMMRLYETAAAQLQDPVGVGQLYARFADFGQDFSRQLDLLAAPLTTSAQLRLVGGLQADSLQRLADTEAARVREMADACKHFEESQSAMATHLAETEAARVREMADVYKHFEQSQSAMATHLAEVAQRADWMPRTSFVKAMLPATTALETYAELALKMTTMPQMVGTQAFLEAVESSVEQYQRFSLDALSALGDKASTRAGVLLGEMLVGGGVLERSVRPLRDVTLTVGLERTLPQVKPNFYGALRRDAGSIVWEALLPSETDVGAELEGLLAVRVADAALALVEVRYRCNRRAQLLYEEVPFKPTVDTELISALLPQTTVTDETGFRQFVDWLYKYVYESTGELKRLLKYLDEQEVETAFQVKFLRGYYFHDLEHGSEQAARKKYRRVGDVFDGIIGKSYPETAADWQAVQLSLLLGLRAIIQKVLGCLRERGPGI